MINTGRFFAKRQEGVVVFILGMRIHNVWNVLKWVRLYKVISSLLNELEHSDDLGYLGSKQSTSFREPLIIQYWNSLDQLHAFAKSPKHTHIKAWREFNQLVGDSEDIGIWHETYVVSGNSHENIYINMPFTGLGQFTPLQLTKGVYANFRDRLEQANRD